MESRLKEPTWSRHGRGDASLRSRRQFHVSLPFHVTRSLLARTHMHATFDVTVRDTNANEVVYLANAPANSRVRVMSE